MTSAGLWATGSDSIDAWFWELVAGDTRAMVCAGDAAYSDGGHEKVEY